MYVSNKVFVQEITFFLEFALQIQINTAQHNPINATLRAEI
jgi:hypothetical protein